MTASNSSVFRFSDIEVRERELRATRAGAPLAIEPKAFRVLAYLLRNPNRLVSKDELLGAVWGDTAVTDNSLTRAIALLRRVLEDDPHQPHFIETVATAGYRFMCPVQITEERSAASKLGVSITAEPQSAVSSLAGSSAASVSKPSFARGKRPWRMLGLVIALLAVVGTAVWQLRHPLPPLHITNYAQLTNDGRLKLIGGTDGNSLYLNLFFPNGTAVIPVSGGRLSELPIDLPVSRGSPGFSPLVMGVSPDGHKLLVGSIWDPSFGHNLWVVGIQGSSARYIGKGVDAAWSPDSKTVVYSSLNGDIYTVSSEGGESRLLYSPGGTQMDPWVQSLVWSPDGGKIRFIRERRYWEVSANGANAHALLPHWHPADPRYNMGPGQWTPGGDFFLFTVWSSVLFQNPIFSQNLTTQIWVLDERRSWLHPRHAELVQLTSGASSWGTGLLAFSKDGTKVYTTSVSSRGELVVHDPKSNDLKPYLGGISAEYVDFSKDGEHIVYVNYPDGVMWRANRDGSGLTQLTSSPLYPMNPRWSPDGTRITFFDVSSSEPAIYLVPSQGGTAQRLLANNPRGQSDPNWSPDGKKIVFTESVGFAMSGTPKVTRILELESGKITDLPPSPRSFFSPRWSPDGRYIVGMTILHDSLMLFDLQRRRWSSIELGAGASCNWLTLSHDGRFVYFIDVDWYVFKSKDPGVYRVSITGNKLEKMVDLKGFAGAGVDGFWFGLDPDDNPLLLRNAGTREIYALTLERK